MDHTEQGWLWGLGMRRETVAVSSRGIANTGCGVALSQGCCVSNNSRRPFSAYRLIPQLEQQGRMSVILSAKEVIYVSTEQYLEVISDHISKHFPLHQVGTSRIAQFPAVKTYKHPVMSQLQAWVHMEEFHPKFLICTKGISKADCQAYWGNQVSLQWLKKYGIRLNCKHYFICEFLVLFLAKMTIIQRSVQSVKLFYNTILGCFF